MTDADCGHGLIIECAELLIHTGIDFRRVIGVGVDHLFDFGEIDGVEIVVIGHRGIFADFVDDRRFFSN